MTFSSRRLVVALFSLLVLGCGCGLGTVDDRDADVPDAPIRRDASSDASSDAAPSDVDADVSIAACAVQHDEVLDGRTIVVCDEAFDEAPLVRLPADSSEGGIDTIYGGLDDLSGPRAIRGRDRDVALGDEEPAWLEAETRAPLPRYASFLYRARVQDGVVLDVTPVVRIDDAVFARLLSGLVFEGVASRYLDDERHFAFDDRDVPIRIRLDVDVEAGVAGTIENATEAVTGADGACLPSLASLGEHSPLYGRTGDRVHVQRYPSMHFPFDDVFVFAWSDADTAGMNMGGGLYVAPSALIRATAPAIVDATNAPHGAPSSGPSATLAVVTGGGEPCTP